MTAIGLIFCAQAARADETTTLRLDVKPPYSEGLAGSLDLGFSSYIFSNRPYFGSEEKSSTMPIVGATLAGRDRHTFVDGNWFYSTPEDKHYFDVRELSENFHREGYNLWFGRHLEEWSQSDSFWRLGYWQPRFNWDKLRPDENGFTGVFVEPEINNNLLLSVFVTPIFLPEFGPDFRESNGTVESANPWFRNPPPVIELWQRNTQMRVSVNTPNTTDTIFKPSLALKATMRSDDETWARVSYAFKPMNTPLMAYNYSVVSLSSATYMDVVVQPQFIYHHIASFESQMKSGEVAIVPSLTYDAPQVPSAPAERISQDMAASLIGSISFVWHPEGVKSESLYGGVMYNWTQFPPDRGENAQNLSQFELRPTWLSAYRLGYEHFAAKLHGRGWGYGVEGTVDPRQNGGEFLSQVRYAWDKQWQSRLRADFIGVLSDASNPYETGFIQTYRANSTLGLDVSYVY